LTVLDGEIVCIDKKGKPQFRDLLFRRGNPCFFAFDLLTLDGKDWRIAALADRKQQLCRLMKKAEPPFPLRYVDHVKGSANPRQSRW
jgi:bifunctional non-homologous end joining protein LigD